MREGEREEQVGKREEVSKGRGKRGEDGWEIGEGVHTPLTSSVNGLQFDIQRRGRESAQDRGQYYSAKVKHGMSLKMYRLSWDPCICV
jgi:hypothetical protein